MAFRRARPSRCHLATKQLPPPAFTLAVLEPLISIRPEALCAAGNESDEGVGVEATSRPPWPRSGGDSLSGCSSSNVPEVRTRRG